MNVNSLIVIALGICISNGHSYEESHLHESSLNIESYHEHEIDFETINEVTFQKRVVGYNYTQEKIGGKHIKYYITDNGNWHIDACSVIGHESTGLKGLYRRLANEEKHRRLNPYWAGTVNGNPAGFWTNGILYYEIAHPTLNMGNFNLAKSKYESQSPVRLIEVTQALKDSGAEWVRIIQGSGCWSYIGKVARGNNQNYIGQDLSLGAGCDGSLATIMHEFGHAFGFFHTQSRTDRDQHVTVHLENIRDDRESQYAIVYYPVCGTYDCGSMMHYRDNSFASCTNCKTMTPVDPNTCVIQRNYADPLSINDRDCLCELYAPGINGQTSSHCSGSVPVENTQNPTESPIVTTTLAPTQVPTSSPIVASQESGFCIHGGSKATNAHENIIGYWEKQFYNDDNGNIYYENKRLSCNNVPLYIYQTTSTPKEWYMSSELNGNTFEAKCTQDNVFDCHNKWQFNGIMDTNLNLIPGRCTQPQCQSLQVTMNDDVNTESMSLSGTYTKTSDNVYENSVYVIQFNDHFEQLIAYSLTNKNSINDCDNTQTIIIGESEKGIIPNIALNVDTPFSWTGTEDAQGFFKCNSLTPTTTTTTPAPRETIQCGDIKTGTLANADDEIIYDFIPNGNLYWAMAFDSCKSTTTNGIDISIKTQNLVNEIEIDNYAPYWCDANPEREVGIFWEKNPSTQYEWIPGTTYSIVVSGVSGPGNFQIDVLCYPSADAFKFGDNNGTEYVFSFKAFGPVQWGIFFGIIIGVIILNIVGCYYVAKCMRKVEKKSKVDEQQLSQHHKNVQHNIELTPDEDNDGNNDGIYITTTDDNQKQ